MNKVILLLVAIFAFVAFANARPLMFFADQTDGPLGLSLGWSGIAYAWTTIKKGQGYYRVRFFGTNHINETLTDAWINFQNGTIIDHLAVNTNDVDRYFLGDLRLNVTVFTALVQEELYITVATDDLPDGVTTGYFRCRPHSGIASITADSVIGGSTSEGVGLGWAEITTSTIHALPTDILDQMDSIAANSHFNGRVLHNCTGTTAVTFNAPANASQTASALATGTLAGLFDDGKFANVTIDGNFYFIDYGQSYYEVQGSEGNIRGQIYPLLTPTRRAIPYKVDTVAGTTREPGAGFASLRYANQEGNDRNSNSYMSLTASPTSGNFTYIGVMYLEAATNKKNQELVRAFTLELNAKILGTGTWVFEFFDSTNGEFVPIGTLTDAVNWTPAFVDDYDFAVSDFANVRSQLVMRVSVNSEFSTSLLLDLFGLRSWVPSSNSNQVLKSIVKFLDAFPGVFSNGTVINE